MRRSVFFLISFVTAAVLTACASNPDQLDYQSMDCATLKDLGERYERTALLDRVDLYNDDRRMAERRNSSSPWADRAQQAGQAETDRWIDKGRVRAAYREKGCR
jgi:hypothetical protein